MIARAARRVFWFGLCAAAASTAMLAVVARLESRGAAQPLNATSHWLNGDRAARRRTADVRHTGVGLGTHVAATMFWAACLEMWTSDRPPRTRLDTIGRAATTAALAALVDYTITPRRFTPGWELVLSKRAMVAVYAAMAVGFVAAGFMATGA